MTRTPPDGPIPAPPDKQWWRSRVLAARRALGAGVHAERAVRLAAHAAGLAVRGETVCAYVPVGTEPGSPALLDALAEAGARVLLPVVEDPDAPLDWAEYEGAHRLVPAARGLQQPGGPRLGRLALADAHLILVPALAVDRDGVRLGRGGGFYDRSLPSAHPGTPLVGVVDDPELVDSLPVDPHDVTLGRVLTPRLGPVRVGPSRPGRLRTGGG